MLILNGDNRNIKGKDIFKLNLSFCSVHCSDTQPSPEHTDNSVLTVGWVSQ